MTTDIVYLVSITSTVGFLILWFRTVKKELRKKLDMVESAKSQFVTYKKNYSQPQINMERKTAKNVLLRSEDIYRQSVTLYNRTLRKPQNRIPGFLMGFKSIKEGEDV